MEHREITERVFETLRSVLHEAGYGMIKRTEEHLGVGSGYLRSARARGVLRLSHLAKILAFLRVPPARFFGRAFPSDKNDAITQFCFEAGAIAARGGEPATVVELRRELDRFRVNDPPPVDRRDEVTLRELERLDALRHDGAREAQRAARQAEVIARSCLGRPEMIARALGVWASAQRVLTRLDEAAVVLALAIEIARRRELREVLGDLAQRSSVIAFDRGDFGAALALSDTALVIHSENGDLGALGRTLVDRGGIYDNLGEPVAAIRCFRSARPHLVAGPVRYRFALLQGLALALLQTGAVERAAELAAEAAEIVPPSNFLVGRLNWARAKIAVERGELERADALYRETLDAFRDQPNDAVLVAAERVRVLLLRGRPGEAAACARQLTWLEGALARNKLVHAALTDLIRSAWISRLELRVVEEVIQRIERGTRGVFPPLAARAGSRRIASPDR